jgi:hypothetical protein
MEGFLGSDKWFIVRGFNDAIKMWSEGTGGFCKRNFLCEFLFRLFLIIKIYVFMGFMCKNSAISCNLKFACNSQFYISRKISNMHKIDNRQKNPRRKFAIQGAATGRTKKFLNF